MHLIANGLISTGLIKAGGKLLLTEQHVYVLKEEEHNAFEAFLVGPVGMWLLRLVGRSHRDQLGPAFLSAAEISELTAGELRSLRDAEPIECLPISPSMDVEMSKAGVVFNVGLRRVRFSSLLSKKKIAAFLVARGVVVK